MKDMMGGCVCIVVVDFDHAICFPITWQPGYIHIHASLCDPASTSEHGAARQQVSDVFLADISLVF